MPSRLIALIVILGLLLAFIGFNLGNKCDISFGIVKVPGVPVYLTIFASFVLGLLCSLPFFLFRSSEGKKKDKTARPKKDGSAPSPEIHGEEGPYGIN
jgi:uncharacterized integral membrane protein